MMRWLFVVTIGVFLSFAAQAETLEPKTFTETFVQHLQATWPDTKVTIKDNLVVQVEGPSGRTIEISLTNLYARHRSNPDGVSELIRDYVAKISPPRGSSTTTAALDRTRIVP